jgi:hypothetical protein
MTTKYNDKKVTKKQNKASYREFSFDKISGSSEYAYFFLNREELTERAKSMKQ